MVINYSHVPVLLKEVVSFLVLKSGGTYLDGTLGGGGYAEAILEAAGLEERLFAVDVDAEAILVAKERLKRFGTRAVLIKGSYAEVFDKITDLKNGIDGAVLDLGISSYQIDEPSRGFSFLRDGPLDMRMGQEEANTAADIINNYSEDELIKIFETFGEERYSKRIASSIINERERKAITTTKELENICWKVYPARERHGKIHPATRVFQALRIFINSELKNLESFLEKIPPILNAGGRLVIVSYHSLEDRIVKRAFINLVKGGGYKLLTKKPVSPSEGEIKNNPRARSAKLRAIIRL